MEFISDLGMARIKEEDKVWFILKKITNVIRGIRYLMIIIQL